jgi:hypothetical protein
MAYADYMHCYVCDCKVHYDSEVDYDDACGTDPIVLCVDCNKTHEIKVVERMHHDSHSTQA